MTLGEPHDLAQKLDTNYGNQSDELLTPVIMYPLDAAAVAPKTNTNMFPPQGSKQ